MLLGGSQTTTGADGLHKTRLYGAKVNYCNRTISTLFSLETPSASLPCHSVYAVLERGQELVVLDIQIAVSWLLWGSSWG